MQMQSATTGINLPRIYNPIKQGRDFDPDGVFIRRWVPELRHAPAPHIHEPWLWPDAARELSSSYPSPIVNEKTARKEAQERIWSIRRQPEYRKAADAIQQKHGSRKSGMPQHEKRRQKARKKQPTGRQMALPFLTSE